jgi:protein kinase-like protein
LNLAEWLKRSRPNTSEQVAMVASLAQAVEEGHRGGRQFSGWSPSRIQVRDGGVDLAALEGRQQEDLAYTAPETADGGAHSPRSDVYSAGVILYEILAGSHPFGGLSVKQPRGAPKPLGDVRRDLPKDLADAVTACLERDPEWRPADLSYVLRVAQEAAASAGAKPTGRPAAPSSTGRVPAAGRRDAMPSLGGRSGAAPSSSSRLPLIAILLVVVLGGAGAAAYFFLGGGGSGGGAATPAPTRVAGAAETSPTPAPTEAATEAPTARPAGTLPPLADKKTPAGSTQTPMAMAATATATATAAPTLVPTTAPTRVAVATSAPTTPPPTIPPTAPPTAAPTAAATAPPAGDPAVLRAIAPPKLKRGQRQLVDVRGDNLRGDLQARFQHKGKPVADIQVARQKASDPALMQMLLEVAAEAPTGSYSLSFVDGQGRMSNAVLLEVVQ